MNISAKNYFRFYIVLYLVIIIIQLIAYKNAESLNQVNTYLEKSGLIACLQSYIMPTWKLQEQQLLQNGYEEFRIRYNLSITYILLCSFAAIALQVLNIKQNLSLYLHWLSQRDKVSIKHIFAPLMFFSLMCFAYYWKFLDQTFTFNSYERHMLSPNSIGILVQGFVLSAISLSLFISLLSIAVQLIIFVNKKRLWIKTNT